MVTSELVAISGSAASGKDRAGLILEQRLGFAHVSCSDVLRKYIADNNLGLPDRETMTRVGRQLRAEKGASFLVDQCLASWNGNRLALSGIYSPAEAQKIKDVGGVVMVVVCKNPAVRWARYQERQRLSQRPETLSFEDFLAAEANENSGQPDQQDIEGIGRLADVIIDNDGTMEEFADQVCLAYQALAGVGHD